MLLPFLVLIATVAADVYLSRLRILEKANFANSSNVNVALPREKVREWWYLASRLR